MGAGGFLHGVCETEEAGACGGGRVVRVRRGNARAANANGEGSAAVDEDSRVRKENEKFGRRRVQQDLMMKGVEKALVSSTLATAYEDVDEVVLARQYIARKRMKQPSGANAQKETVRAMNRLMRAGFSSNAIFKVLRAWDLPEEALAGVEEGGVDSDSYAEPEERAGDSDGYSRQNEDE